MSETRLFVALGDLRFQIERPWGPTPSSGRVTDVAIGADDHLFVLLRRDPLVDPAADPVLELDREGNVVRTWGSELIADSHMVTCANDGRLFIVDRDAHEVVICSRDGQRLGGLGRRDSPLDPFNHPTNVAFAPGGEIYVSDGYANHKVHRFSADGELIGSWGVHGHGQGAFINPHAIWVRGDGRVLVVDRGNNRIQVFTPDGVWLEEWTGFSQPLGIWADADDNVFVTDLVPSLSMFSKAGKLLGRCRPVLNGAHGVTGDSSGNIYLAEGNPSRVTRLRLVRS